MNHTVSVQLLGVGQRDNDVYLYSKITEHDYTRVEVAISKDALGFSRHVEEVVIHDFEASLSDVTSFKVSRRKEDYVLFIEFGLLGDKKVGVATSQDLIQWNYLGVIKSLSSSGALVPNYTHNGDVYGFFGSDSIDLLSSSDIVSWNASEKALLSPQQSFFDNSPLSVATVFTSKKYIVVVYYVKSGKKPFSYSVGTALFYKEDPRIMLWRTSEPLWVQPEEWEGKNTTALGAVYIDEKLHFYWLVEGMGVFSVVCSPPLQIFDPEDSSYGKTLQKYEKNPIIEPMPDNHWESKATFNTAAIFEDGKIHFLYRAIGDNDVSMLGYATSSDGVTVDDRHRVPAYIPTQPFECPGQKAIQMSSKFMSGGGHGGCEDPRLTKIDDRVYLTYVAYDGCTAPKCAMSSIALDDFLANNWNWETPRIISSSDVVNKNAVIFPERINGKYVVFHRVYPNILIDYLDDLSFDKPLVGHEMIRPDKNSWDSKKVGAGAPPIKTDDGWLLIYHSVGYQDPGRYKIGAMLLDLDDPKKVLCRSKRPIIEPNEWYENKGHKAGVAYPCGAVVAHGKLFVYYGGADTVVCVASEDFDVFMDDLKTSHEPKLHSVSHPHTVSVS